MQVQNLRAGSIVVDFTIAAAAAVDLPALAETIIAPGFTLAGATVNAATAEVGAPARIVWLVVVARFI